MKIVKAQRGDILWKIVYKHYKTLNVYVKVLEANDHLVKKMILDDGDIINLPVLTIKENLIKKVNTLW